MRKNVVTISMWNKTGSALPGAWQCVQTLAWYFFNMLSLMLCISTILPFAGQNNQFRIEPNHPFSCTVGFFLGIIFPPHIGPGFHTSPEGLYVEVDGVPLYPSTYERIISTSKWLAKHPTGQNTQQFGISYSCFDACATVHKVVVQPSPSSVLLH